MPLTCYHLTQNLYLKNRTCPQSMNIHMLGVEGEMLNTTELETYFVDLLKFKNPNLKTVKLILVGPAVRKTNVKKEGNVQVYSGLWSQDHEAVKKFPPQLIIALNAGLGAYATWYGTVQSIVKSGVTFLSTDYTRYSCKVGISVINGMAPMGIKYSVYPKFDKRLQDYPIPFNAFAHPVRDDRMQSYFEEYGFLNGYVFGLNVNPNETSKSESNKGRVYKQRSDTWYRVEAEED